MQPSSSPTPVVIDPSDLMLAELNMDGFHFFEGGHVHQFGEDYFAYTFLDTPVSSGFPTTDGFHTCRSTFLHGFGEMANLLGFVDHQAVFCRLINWDNRSLFWHEPFGPAVASDDPNGLLDLTGYSSDINQNGLPEFAIEYQYCGNGCENWGIVNVRFFEIQTDMTIIDITNGLPGSIDPHFHLIHANIPGTLYGYERTYAGPNQYIYSWWIYRWNGMEFEDATSEFTTDILAWGSHWLEQVRAKYGQPLDWFPYQFGEILLQYDKAGLRQEAIDIINEITDPSHWPESDDLYICYIGNLQEQANAEFMNGTPFSPPRDIVDFMMGPEYLPCEN